MLVVLVEWFPLEIFDEKEARWSVRPSFIITLYLNAVLAWLVLLCFLLHVFTILDYLVVVNTAEKKKGALTPNIPQKTFLYYYFNLFCFLLIFSI